MKKVKNIKHFEYRYCILYLENLQKNITIDDYIHLEQKKIVFNFRIRKFIRC